MADLNGKRVLVTGGAGFIGSHIVDLLCDEGCAEIIALDNMVRGRPENLEYAKARGPVSLVHGDIRDSNLMASLVKFADIVFHQAALRITHCAAEPRLAMEVMVQSTFDLLELCVQHKIGRWWRRLRRQSTAWPTSSRRLKVNIHTTIGLSTALPRLSMRAYFARSTICMGSITLRFDTFTFTGRAWIFTA